MSHTNLGFNVYKKAHSFNKYHPVTQRSWVCCIFVFTGYTTNKTRLRKFPVQDLGKLTFHYNTIIIHVTCRKKNFSFTKWCDVTWHTNRHTDKSKSICPWKWGHKNGNTSIKSSTRIYWTKTTLENFEKCLQNIFGKPQYIF